MMPEQGFLFSQEKVFKIPEHQNWKENQHCLGQIICPHFANAETEIQ